MVRRITNWGTSITDEAAKQIQLINQVDELAIQSQAPDQVSGTLEVLGDKLKSGEIDELGYLLGVKTSFLSYLQPTSPTVLEVKVLLGEYQKPLLLKGGGALVGALALSTGISTVKSDTVQYAHVISAGVGTYGVYQLLKAYGYVP